MKLAVNLALSFAMLALCLWLVWPGATEQKDLATAFKDLEWRSFAPYLAGYFGLQVIVHLCRSLRWNHLLAPLGVRVPAGPLLAISSVGFMAILALPARLGEFVRPGLLRKRGVSASAALGTVAVERIVDGLLISLLVFATFFSMRGPHAPGWMMPTAYTALGVFSVALVFILFAMRWPERTVTFCMRMSLLPRFAPRIAAVIEHKVLDMIRGFAVLRDGKNMTAFLAWSLVYWTANAIGVWLLALAFGLDLSLAGGFAVMGLVGVGISLPNSPGLVGQFQWFTLLGLAIYLGPGALKEGLTTITVHGRAIDLHAQCLAYAITQHLLQVAWYVGMGALGLATPWVSFADLRSARKVAPDAPTGDDPADAQAAR